MPLATPARIVNALARHGYNADREAVTLLAGAPNTDRALERAIEVTPEDALTLSTERVRAIVDDARDCDDRDCDGRRNRDTGRNQDGRRKNRDHPRNHDGRRDGSEERNGSSVTSTDGSSADTIPRNDSSTSEESPDRNAPLASNSSVDDSGNADQDSTPGVSDQNPVVDQSSVSGGNPERTRGDSQEAPLEIEGSVDSTGGTAAEESSVGSASVEPTTTEQPDTDRTADPEVRDVTVTGDITGHSTGTGTYTDFVTTFRDRYERLSKLLRSRVNHRPTEAVHAMAGGSDAAMIGMISDIRSTANGHWLVELEDTTGTFPCLIMKDRALAGLVDELLYDEVIAVEGTLAGDGGILFVDDLHFPDVPRTYQPSTADRHVRAALISDVHVGSEEFRADAWGRFADWLHTAEAAEIEYLLLAGDMVEGVGVYPGQDEELDIVDLYAQYERFSELLKQVPGDLDIVMIPGNHDAVRLAEPQPGFDEELRTIMSAHDARIVSNPSTVTLEGVSFLLYHGVSLDEVIAELPEEKASYDRPHDAMSHLLKKRHVAPQYGGHTRLAPEDRDYLVMEDVPDVFHTGHVHKLGYGKYHGVLTINSGCWQDQTSFQRSVNIDPDVGYAPIVDLDTLELTIQKFT